MNGRMKRLIGLSSIGFATLISTHAEAAGYKMEFQSASVLADAGDAAVVEDASTNWYNSAGLLYVPQQAVYSLFDVYAPTTFTGSMTAPSTLNTLPSPINTLGSNYATYGSVSSHPNSIIPAIHYSHPFLDRYAFGVSIAPAWGLAEDYGEHSKARYTLTKVYTRTIDVAPSIAIKFNDHWSFGIGPDFNYFSVQSRSHVRTEGAPPFGTANDSISRFSANRWGYGGHAGVLFRVNDALRFGLNYRSKIVMNLDGYSDFALNGVAGYHTGLFKIHFPHPPTTTLSGYYDINPVWAVMGTLAYDQWSVLRDYHANNYIQPPTPGNPSGLLPNVVQKQNMQNTVDVSAGFHYKWSDILMFRGSLKYEPTPTINKYRQLDFPDPIKLGVNIGLRYQYSKKIAIDAMYAHVFEKTMHINDVNPVTASVASGNSTSHVDLVGAQLVWTI